MKDFDYVKIHNVNPLYLTIDEVDGSVGKVYRTIT